MFPPVCYSLPSGLQLAGWYAGAAPLTQPVLCLHGWLDNANSFLPLAQAMPDLPLLALDLAGHGHSSHRSPDAHYYLLDYVSDIATLCRQQQWQQLTVVGHSMGGMVATVLAANPVACSGIARPPSIRRSCCSRLASRNDPEGIRVPYPSSLRRGYTPPQSKY